MILVFWKVYGESYEWIWALKVKIELFYLHKYFWKRWGNTFETAQQWSALRWQQNTLQGVFSISIALYKVHKISSN